jgi:hypothetical protein
MAGRPGGWAIACAGAVVLMATLADRTSLPWPEDFPRKIERKEPVDPTD